MNTLEPLIAVPVYSGGALLEVADNVVEVGGNAPFILDDPDYLWVVLSGRVDVFATRMLRGPRRYLWSAEAGAGLRGINREGGVMGLALLAVATPGTRLCRVSVEKLQALAGADETLEQVVSLLDNTVSGVASAVSSRVQPAIHAQLRGEQSVALELGKRAGAGAEPQWVRVAEGAAMLIDDDGAVLDPSSTAIPLARGLWVTAITPEARLTGVTTAECLRAGEAWEGLAALLSRFVTWVVAQVMESEAVERARMTTRAQAEERMLERGILGLASVIDDSPAVLPPADSTDPLLAACRTVGAALGIEFQAAPRRMSGEEFADPLDAICSASRVRARRVALRGEWWRHESGPLLVRREQGGGPAAAIPLAGGGYELIDPLSATRTRVTAATAAELEPFAHTFYPPAPDRPLGALDLARIALAEARADSRRIGLFALLGGLAGLVVPMATARIFNDLVPGARISDVNTMLGALVAVALGTAFFDVARAFGIIRVEGKTNARLQETIIDRLLALPVDFFRDFSVGDLASRADAINRLRELLSGAAVTTLLGALFGTLNLAILFYFNPILALAAVVLAAAAAVVTIVPGWAALKYERRRKDAEGRIAGLVFQLIGGVAKLRVAAAERRAFAIWAESFREQQRLAFQVGRLSAIVTTFNAVLPALSTLGLFVAASYIFSRGQTLEPGTFVAFSGAFGIFFASAVSISNTFIQLLDAGPILERARPILRTTPEVDASRPDPGELTGRIEVDQLTFRYRPDTPPVLSEVSLRAEPGEFIALVGASGSGKSTVLRHLLGFESPETGAVYYDGQDLASIDVRAVRRQIGVVLQTSRLLSGSIQENLIGSSTLTIDDAWQAAELAGIADEIRDMPMGMHTVVGEGGGTLSGGQRQRLLIARALIHRPRIIFFDEATSALDNRTQALISRSISALNATRVVIAHRLSTIRNADRVYVMERGRIVETGSYDELVQQRGLFFRLVERQRL